MTNCKIRRTFFCMEQSCQDKFTKIAIVGAGPAGIYCALNMLFEFKRLNFKAFSISVFDKGQALRTILPTGGSKCNLTNAIADIKEFASNYPRGEKFMYSLFSKHFSFDSLEFFEKIGIKTYARSDNRIFPLSNSSKDVKDKMLSAFRQFAQAKLINKNILSKDDLSEFDRIIIATGSRGAQGLINSFNQPFKPFKSVLCALKVQDFHYPEGVTIKSKDGDFIFTNEGISGPLAYKISSLNVDKNFPYEISIELFDYLELFNLIQKNPKKQMGTLLSEFVPKSFAKAICPEFDKKAAEISKEKIKGYSCLKLVISGAASGSEVVNSGGVRLDSVDKNCKSKVVENLWFCGEILDIDGFCGGFNLQNCWSSAYVVAKDVVSSIIKK